MFDGPVEVNIGNMGEGALEELFQHAVQKVTENIADLNTQPDAKRSINIKITFKPTEDRKTAETVVSCETKLAGVRAVKSSIFFATQNGAKRAFTEDPRQAALFAKQETPTPKAQ